jgi:hypothetical protein
LAKLAQKLFSGIILPFFDTNPTVNVKICGNTRNSIARFLKQNKKFPTL